jgi:hypothetical protein
MEQLISILETRRQHDTAGEASFIERFIMPLKPRMMTNPNGEVIAYVVENTHGHSTVLWSAHVDTMHRDKAGQPNPLTQEVWLGDDGIAFVTDKEDCLGADDGAGMYLMLEMIMNDVAGTYIFHRGEEIGCWGSSAMATHHRDWLSTFTHAIAFDRRGTTSIITHQRSERACSDKLGNQLADLFGLGYVLDPTGVYTDTAEYMDIIPECVNVSIGYDSEHSHRETLDTNHVLALRDAIVALDWDKITLIAERDPSVQEFDDYDMYGSRGMWGNSWSTSWGNAKKTTAPLSEYDVPSVETILSTSTLGLAQWVAKADPEDVAMLLQTLADQLEEASYALEDYYDEHSTTHLKAGMM